MRAHVWTEVGLDGKVIRIFKSRGEDFSKALMGDRVRQMARSVAVAEVRKRLWERCNEQCELCGKPITWHRSEMHERVLRSLGGEISVFNSILICPMCHGKEHSNRKLHWGGL